MHDHTSENNQNFAQNGPGKIADRLNKTLTPAATYIAYAGAALLGGLVLMLIYSIVARRAFNAPLKGSMEMTELALGVITFLILAYDSLRGESMIVDILVNRFPSRVKAILGTIIRFFSTAILGVLCWQLIVQGVRVHNFHQTTVILGIPVYPFLFVGAFGAFFLALVYLMHFFYSLDKAWRR